MPETAHSQQKLDETAKRPLPPISGGIAGAEEIATTQMDSLVNHLLLICPLQHEEWETTMGDADVLVSYILDIRYELSTEDNSVSVDWDDLGELPIFWQRVKKQLDEQASAERPWVLGKLTRPGRAYEITAPLPEDYRAAEVVLAEYREATEEQF
jgi:hypothetical protein